MKSYLYVGLAILLLAGVGWVYGLWRDYQSLKYQHQMALQNTQAWKDSASSKAAKIGDLAVQVRLLIDENKGLKNEKIVLITRNRILLDSLHISGRADSTIFGDSTIYVKFSGTEKFAHFDGYTFTNLRTDSSTWNLALNFDDLSVNTSLYQADGIWRYKTESLTEGVMIKTINSTLDEETYAALQKYSPPEPPKNFGFNLQASPADLWGGAIIRFNNQWYLNANYKLTNNQPNWSDNVLVGLSFFIF